MPESDQKPRIQVPGVALADPKIEPDPFPRPDVTDLTNGEPQGDHLILKRWPKQTLLAGGMVLPDSAVQKQEFAWVLKAGPEVPRFHPGDVVTFQPHAAVEIDALGTDMLYIRASDVVIRWPITPTVTPAKE
uniref:Putative chaperonin n=1 Tax=viral metagenome TaxID=1070528 RepID=A0A6H1ZHW7_9ZZZZ